MLAGRTDLLELAAQVGAPRGWWCAGTRVWRTSPPAFGTPSVLLFGPMPPSRWGPLTDGPHTVLWHGPGVGDPWGDQVDPALLRIAVDEVVSAAERQLRR